MNQEPDSRLGVWVTPQDFFNKLNEEFHFTVDVAADAENTKCERFYDELNNGLAQDWSGERVWCNPPYGRSIGKWVQKLAEEKTEVAVGLLPARTDTKWFHAHILGKAEIRFIKGRIKFSGMKASGKFPSMVCIWRPNTNL